MKKRFGIALVGGIRDFRNSIPSFLKNVVEPNLDEFDVEIVVSANRYDYDREFESMIANYCVGTVLLENFGDEVTDEATKRFIKRAKLTKVKDDRTFSGLFSQLRHMHYAKNLLSARPKYDVVMKTRPDILYHTPIKVGNLDLEKFTVCDESFIYRYAIPNVQEEKRTVKNTPYGKVNDPVVVSSGINMHRYHNMFDYISHTEIENIKGLHISKPESFATYYVSKVLNKEFAFERFDCGLWRGKQ